MRTELALAACILTAPAQASGVLAPDRFSVGLPVEGHLIGAAAGLHPELLWRPFAADGAMHLRASVGVLPGLEYTFVPMDLGVRWVWKPWWFFQPLLGAGLESQSFVVGDGGPFWRSAVYAEFGTGLALTDDIGFAASVIPSFAPIGVPGPGLAGRITLTFELDVRAAETTSTNASPGSVLATNPASRPRDVPTATPLLCSLDSCPFPSPGSLTASGLPRNARPGG
jgi:hypothetical protein